MVSNERGLCAVVVAIACAALLLHGANLLRRARADGCRSVALLCRTDRGPWGVATGDFVSYQAVANDILGRGGVLQGVWTASYYRRTPGYPFLLALSVRLTGDEGPVHWLGPLLAAGAAGAVTWLGGLLTGRVRGALLSGLLFCVWLNAYQFSAAFRPDGPHAFLAVMATASTLWWREQQRTGAAVLSAGLWMATQSLRPTFFALPLVLPVLLWRRGCSRRYRRASLGLWTATLLVPGFVVASNRVQHGVATPSLVGSHALACYAVPRLQADMGLGRFGPLRRECKKRFRDLPLDERPGAETRWALSVLRLHPRETARSFLLELRRQLLYPLRLSAQGRYAPRWARTGTGVLLVFWACAVGGWLVLARRHLPLAVFLALCFALVMLPASASYGVGARLRLPAVLLLLPLPVVLVERALGFSHPRAPPR